MASFIEISTGQTYPIDKTLWRAPNGKPLTVSDLPGITRAEVKTSVRSIWRYADALPVKIIDPVSLGEGCTPMINPRIDDYQFDLKLEWFSPTGSFKDRGVSVLISFLKQEGIKEFVEDSSGNAGASMAAYAAAAGMKAKILVPAYTQPSKVDQSKAFGAEVVLVPGERDDTSAAAINMADEYFYASHNWHPMFVQGTKTIGYEIWEDLDFKVPDNIVMPVSEGSNLLGCYIAFSELLRAGEINHLPRLFAVQPENCAPLHHQLQGTRQKQFLPTVAEGTAVRSPTRLDAMIDAINATDGGAVINSEAEIIAASKRLARAGILTEPSSAQAWSAARKLVDNGRISESERTVVILTGTGLKAQSAFSQAS